MKKFYFIFSLLLTIVTLNSYAEVLVEWKRIPIPIDLNVNQERILFVDKNVRVGIPNNLGSKLRVQSSGGAVYFKALEPFDLTRIQLRDIETGQLILLDVRSESKQGKIENVRLIFNDNVENNRESVSQVKVSDSNEKISIKNSLPIPAALTRYAAQSLYAPLRTIEPLPGIQRVAMKLPKSLPSLLPNLSAKVTPLESWGLGDYVVTAIKIKNLENYRVDLDPRYLQGKFYSATFQHNWVGGKGSLEDTTVVYIVTVGGIDKAIIRTQTQSKKHRIIKKIIDAQ